jgi:hypothetical protein
MRLMHRGVLLVVLFAAVMATNGGVALGADAVQAVDCASADGERVGQELAVGDMIRDGAAGASVPKPGEGVVSDVLLFDGSESLEVRTAKDGTVEVEDCGPEVEPKPSEVFARSLRKPSKLAKASALGECEDNWWQIESYRWYWGYGWYLKQDTVPAGLSIANVANAVEEGTQSITATRNKCGMADVVPITQFYGGNTTTWGNFSGEYCAPSDGHNVTDFGGLGGSTIAATCTWLNEAGVAGSSDLRFNQGLGWMPNGSGTCGGFRYVIRSVTAHERGHTFGIAHVSEAGHPTLTMSTLIEACSDGEFWLGKGDVNGLDARY